MTIRALLVSALVFAACASSADPSARAGSRPELFREVLRVIADSSRFGPLIRVDPRLIAVGAMSYDTTMLVPISNEELQRNRAAAEELGMELGDFFVALECDPAGRISLIKGGDTLMAAGRAPIHPERRSACAAQNQSKSVVLIQRQPQRIATGWVVEVHLAGGGRGEEWRIQFDDEGEPIAVEQLLSWSH